MKVRDANKIKLATARRRDLFYEIALGEDIKRHDEGISTAHHNHRRYGVLYNCAAAERDGGSPFKRSVQGFRGSCGPPVETIAVTSEPSSPPEESGGGRERIEEMGLVRVDVAS